MEKIMLFFGLVLITGLMSCSSLFVKSDYDREVSFANYQTFDLVAQPQNPSSYPPAHYTPSEKRIKNAVDRELSAMGYQKQTTGEPDFLIVYIITFADESEDQLEDKLEQTLRGYEYMGYSYKGFYDAEEQDVRQYREDTLSLDFLDLESNELILILDFIDPESKQLIWQGWYVGAIEDREITEAEITKAVKYVLEKFHTRQ